VVITVEPIIAVGSGRAFVARDTWTVVAADHRPSAHYEHTLVITGSSDGGLRRMLGPSGAKAQLFEQSLTRR